MWEYILKISKWIRNEEIWNIWFVTCENAYNIYVLLVIPMTSGIELDGEKKFNNLSEALGPDGGQVTLHQDPTVEQFSGVIPYDPSKQSYIDIKVK